MVKLKKTRKEIEGRWTEEYVAVEEDTIKPWVLNDDLKYVGKKVPRADGPEKSSGYAKYTHDIQLPGMLYGRILRCPYPHARIKSIDISDAEKLRGVHIILTAKNSPKIPWYGGSLSNHFQSFLFDETLRYQGDEVAFAVAEDESIAEDALELVNIEYEQLPFVVDSVEALKPNAPKVHSEGNVFSGKPVVYERGNVERGFSQADVVLEETFRTQTAVHNSLETHGSVAMWESDSLTVWDSTQGINGVRSELARALDIPVRKVKVIAKYIGGGFGSKVGAKKYTVMAALASRQTNRPVKAVLDRIEENLATGHRSKTVQRVRIGCNKDGTLVALQLNAIINLGCYTEWSSAPSGPYQTMYRCPNVKTEEYSVYTNIGPWDAFRAPGYVEGTFSLEAIMDMMADKLSIDPIDLMLKNYVEVDQNTNLPYSSKGLREAYLEGLKKSDWKFKRTISGTKNGVARGIGAASQIWFGGGGPPGYALVRVNKDGTASGLTATQDIGTGTKTALTQILAEELSFPINKVEIFLGDTQAELFAGGSGGSATLASMGPAVRSAALDAKMQILDAASQLLEAPSDILELKDGNVKITETGKTIGVDEIMGQLGDFMIVGKGARGPNPDGRAISTFGVQFAEVEVDLETGQVNVQRMVAVHESGKVVNPLMVESQIEGGIVQGIGFALMEERRMSKDSGNVMNSSFADYWVPSSEDVPEVIPVILEVEDSFANNLGAKGIGEPPIIPAPAAIANAIKDAIGVRMTELPITPTRILEALGKIPKESEKDYV